MPFQTQQHPTVVAAGTYYFSPVHFTASYNDETTLDISGLPTELQGIDDRQITDVTVFYDDGTVRTYVNGPSKFEWTDTGGGNATLVVEGAHFTNTATFRVGILGGPIGSGGSSGSVEVVSGDHPLQEEFTGTVNSGVTATHYALMIHVTKAAVVRWEIGTGKASIDILRSLDETDDSTDPTTLDYDDCGFDRETSDSGSWVYNVGDMGPAGYLKITVTGELDGTDYTINVIGA